MATRQTAPCSYCGDNMGTNNLPRHEAKCAQLTPEQRDFRTNDRHRKAAQRQAGTKRRKRRTNNPASFNPPTVWCAPDDGGPAMPYEALHDTGSTATPTTTPTPGNNKRPYTRRNNQYQAEISAREDLQMVIRLVFPTGIPTNDSASLGPALAWIEQTSDLLKQR